MLLLVTDTSGKDGFVGLARAGEGQHPDRMEVIEEVALAGGTFSAQLIPQISGLLAKHGFSKSDIGAFIVVSGPGSFTGLRVGLAAIKALAEILQKPIIPVSLLDVLARSTPAIAVIEEAEGQMEFHYAVALDASRGEAFVGEYDAKSDRKHRPRALGESLLTLDNLAALLESGVLRWLSTPDPSIFEALNKRVSESKKRCIRRVLRRPRSEEVAMIGWQRLNAGETVSPEQLEANYIRRTDAEIFSKPASSS